MIRVLFLCTGNSCRSQMAEGITNHFFKGKVEARSAGTNPTLINPLSIKVMKEIGIDISGQTVNFLDDFKNEKFDYVITLCDNAREACPLFIAESSVKKIHMGFPDPAELEGTGEEILAGFRKVRDDIKDRLIGFFKD